MHLRSRAVVAAGAAAAALAAAPAAHAAAPAALKPVVRTLDAAVTKSAACATAVRRAPRGASYRAPVSGFLDVRMSGRGDWDLALRDRAGRRLGASQGFGGSEVVQTWVRAGERVTAAACRKPGARGRARVSFGLLAMDLPKAATEPTQWIRVFGPHQKLEELEHHSGLDVTHSKGVGFVDAAITGAKELAVLKATGLKHEVKTKDLGAQTAAFRRRELRRLDDRRASALPSGRETYRTYEDYQAELKRLVDQHPGVVRPVTFGKSYQGRDVTGIEIGKDVDGDDGRPVFFLMGIHHAREWPAGEVVMEYAQHLVEHQSDPRVKQLLETQRAVILPLVNPDGYITSRTTPSPVDQAGFANGEVDTPIGGLDPALAEIVAPPGGVGAYRRKNCNGPLGPSAPCNTQYGVDNNRNYANLWGGPGGSPDVTSQSFKGAGPRSEPETQNVWNYVRTHHVTSLVSVHTIAALILRPPGLKQVGFAPDEERMKEIGDAMGKATGYQSQYSFQLYDTAGTTEDDTYAATGGYGWTYELGPSTGGFHGDYQTAVVDQWTGASGTAERGQGVREGFMLAAEAASRPADHALLKGTAPAGKVLRLKKQFDTKTSDYCPAGVEPVINIGPVDQVCPQPAQPAITVKDELNSTTKVPGSGAFTWHIGQSTRPFVNGGARFDTLEETPIKEFRGAGTAPGGDEDLPFTLDAAASRLKVVLTPDVPVEDYDLTLLRKDGDQLVQVGSSGNPPGSGEEILLADAPAGEYVLRVTYFAAATGAYTATVSKATAKSTFSPNQGKERYTLTCEEPDGKVLETQSIQVDRGQQVVAKLGCGKGPSTISAPGPQDGTTPGGPGTRPGTGTAPGLRLQSVNLRQTRKGLVKVRVTCPAGAKPCKGRVTFKAKLGRRTRTLTSKAFIAKAGARKVLVLKLKRSASRELERRRRIRATVTATAKQGTRSLRRQRTLVLRAHGRR